MRRVTNSLHLTVAVAAIAGLVVLGCGDPSGEDGRGAPIADEFGLSEGFRSQGAAAFGADLVVVGSAVQPGEPANNEFVRRNAAGDLEKLPNLPTGGAFRIATAGPSVIAGGVSCGDRPVCDEGPAVLYRLREDASGWDELYRGDDVLPFDVEVTAARGARDYGWIQIDAHLFLVDPDGALLVGPFGAEWRELPTLDAPGVGYGVPSFFCDLGDRQIVIPAVMGPVEGVTGIDGLGTVNGAVWELRYDQLGAGWRQIGDAPSGLSNLGAVAECGGSTMIIHAEDGEHVFDTATLTWSSRPESFEQLHGSPVFSLQQPGSIAVAPNGTTVFAVTGGRLIVRPGGGPWVDGGHMATSVYSTDVGVVALQENEHGTDFIDLEWE